MDQVYKDIISSFGALWHCVPRGNTIEAVTPYATINGKFVSVFITQQGSEYVVTDGGWYSSGEYEIEKNGDKAYERLFVFYEEEYSIKHTKANNGLTYYYKTTKDSLFIPNLVFDLANFISAVVSGSFVQFSDLKEEKIVSRFSRDVKNYISSILPNQAKFDQPINDEYKSVKFGAIINPTPNSMVLIAYITGSSPRYFADSIGRASMNFEIIKNSTYSSVVSDMIPIIDNTAFGYQPINVAHQVSSLQRQVGNDVLLWSEKERLQQRVS